MPRATALQARPSLAGLLCPIGLLYFPQHHSHPVLSVRLCVSTAGYLLVSALAQRHAGVRSVNAISHLVCSHWRGVLRGGLEESAGNSAQRVHRGREGGTAGKHSCISEKVIK